MAKSVSASYSYTVIHFQKKPGHIKTHVTVASMRLILSMVGVLMYGAHTFNSMVFCYTEIGKFIHHFKYLFDALVNLMLVNIIKLCTLNKFITSKYYLTLAQLGKQIYIFLDYC